MIFGIEVKKNLIDMMITTIDYDDDQTKIHCQNRNVKSIEMFIGFWLIFLLNKNENNNQICKRKKWHVLRMTKITARKKKSNSFWFHYVNYYYYHHHQHVIILFDSLFLSYMWSVNTTNNNILSTVNLWDSPKKNIHPHTHTHMDKHGPR